MSSRILVVDDVLPNVKLLEAKLSREYYDVITASDGFEALEQAHAHKPDLILLDIMMPGMDGFEVCRKLKDDPETMHIPVVMVTALSDASDRVRGLEAGADEFLTKPVDDVALFARVRSLVRLKTMMDEWRVRDQTSGEFGVVESSAGELSDPGTGARVLAVEDNAVDAEKIRSTLSRDDHDVVLARTIAEGQAALQDREFELLIVSLTLEEEDGLRFVSSVRSQERTRQTPILLTADDGDLKSVAKGLDLGANDYIVKPMDRNELLARARTQVRRKRYQDRLRDNYERSLMQALTDSLTGLFNRRYLTSHLTRVIKRIDDKKKPVSAIVFDIDRFKAVNDTHGHNIGDEVLKEVAQRASRNLRSFDMIARWGGEEFIVVLPDMGEDTAALVAERLRHQIGDTPIAVSNGIDLPITVSLGIASTEDSGESTEALLQRADQALYEAKGAGRNCVYSDSLGAIPNGYVPAGQADTGLEAAGR